MGSFRKPSRGVALGAFVALALLVAIPGCGGSDGSDTTAAARQQAAELHREEKILALKRRLQIERAKRAVQEAQAQMKAEESKPSAVPPASGGSLSGFDQLAASLPGEVGVAIGPPGSGPAAVAGGLTTGSAWSTSKVPVAMRVLAEAGGPAGLSSAQAEQVRRALTLSDNEAALALFGDLEAAHGGPQGAAAAVDEVLAEAGDTTTRVSSEGRDGFTPFGQTEWSVALQEQFMSALAAGCVGSPQSSEYVLGLMGEVSSDTWGLGSAGLPARWKGGWGTGVDGRYLARQMGVLSVGGEEAAVALAVLPSDGSFETAQTMATSVAAWLAEQAPEFAGPVQGC